MTPNISLFLRAHGTWLTLNHELCSCTVTLPQSALNLETGAMPTKLPGEMEPGDLSTASQSAHALSDSMSLNGPIPTDSNQSGNRIECTGTSSVRSNKLAHYRTYNAKSWLSHGGQQVDTV